MKKMNKLAALVLAAVMVLGLMPTMAVHAHAHTHGVQIQGIEEYPVLAPDTLTAGNITEGTSLRLGDNTFTIEVKASDVIEVEVNHLESSDHHNNDVQFNLNLALVSSHTHSYEAVVTAPTCTEGGCTTYTCACGDSYVADETAALGHDYVAEFIEPTCTKSGYTLYTCTRCGHSYKDDPVEPEHKWDEGTVVAPTCTELGCTVYTCLVCGFQYEDEASWTPALGHDYINGACSRCDSVLEATFVDVPVGSFFFDPVEWAVEGGITNGVDADHFGPNSNCMRAVVVTFLWRAAGEPEPTSTNNPFVDVNESDFFYKAVLWAVENGITNGLDATHFGPTADCNRAQVVTFLYRAMKKPAYSATESGFTDVTEPTAFYYDAVLWAVENGITNGMGGDTFGINAICNRAQVVTFLYRTDVD